MRALLSALVVLMLSGFAAYAGAPNPCPRPAVGSEIANPPALTSQNGVLKAKLFYYTSMDDAGHTLFCFVTDKGDEAPTLRVNPGDTLKLTLANMIPPGAGPAEKTTNTAEACASDTMVDGSINMHFHGTNTSPQCHGDNIIHTLINPGESYSYTIKIPKDEPSGLYWYHHHVHSLSEAALLGGASGLIEIMGIENVQPAVAGLPQRLLTIRDQPPSPPKGGARDGFPPSNDVSLNYVPVLYPDYQAGVIKVQSGTQEFWRVANASANTIMDIQLRYDGKAQPLQIVALDGVATGSQEGKRQGKIITAKDIMLPPGNRAEFIIDTPGAGVAKAELVTLDVDAGHFGDKDPERPLATIQATAQAPGLPLIPKATRPARPQRFEGLAEAPVSTQRLLYFSEVGTNFFITVDGQDQELFDPNNPPAITTQVGAVEEWTVQNRVNDEHIFHIHQIHFLLEKVNGVDVPKKQRQFYDTYPVSAWRGTGDYPSITVKMDFRGPIAGDFVYHCHILGHEDHGMMAIIRVLPKG